jgi:hypothetical protein
MRAPGNRTAHARYGRQASVSALHGTAGSGIPSAPDGDRPGQMRRGQAVYATASCARAKGEPLSVCRVRQARDDGAVDERRRQDGRGVRRRGTCAGWHLGLNPRKDSRKRRQLVLTFGIGIRASSSRRSSSLPVSRSPSCWAKSVIWPLVSGGTDVAIAQVLRRPRSDRDPQAPPKLQPPRASPPM